MRHSASMGENRYETHMIIIFVESESIFTLFKTKMKTHDKTILQRPR